MAKISDLTLLSDIFPTGYHGAVTAGVGPGSVVYVAGAGPVGLASAAACHLLGAAVVIVGDMIPERLAQAKSFGCETIDLKKDAVTSRSDRTNPGRSRSGFRRWTVWGSRRAAMARCGRGAPGHRAEFPDDRNSRGRMHWVFPGLYVTDDPGGSGSECEDAERWESESASAGRNLTPSPLANALSCGTTAI